MKMCMLIEVQGNLVGGASFSAGPGIISGPKGPGVISMSPIGPKGPGVIS